MDKGKTLDRHASHLRRGLGAHRDHDRGHCAPLLGSLA
jgi:hypothetical protein